MSLYSALFIFAVLAGGMWLIYKFTPEPLKTVLLWIVGIAIVFFLLSMMGIIPWMKSVTL